MPVSEYDRLAHLEWQALLVLYRHREQESTHMRFVGYRPAISKLIRHEPPLAAWVGNPKETLLHITDEGIAHYKVEQSTR